MPTTGGSGHCGRRGNYFPGDEHNEPGEYYCNLFGTVLTNGRCEFSACPYVGNSPTSYVDPTGMFRAGAGGGTVYLCQNGGGAFTDETLTRTIGEGGGQHVNAFDTNG